MKQIITLFAMFLLFTSCSKDEPEQDYTCVCTGSSSSGGTASYEQTIRAKGQDKAKQGCSELSNAGIVCKLK